MHILIYSKEESLDNWKFIETCISELHKKNINIYFLGEFYEKIKSKLKNINASILTKKHKP